MTKNLTQRRKDAKVKAQRNPGYCGHRPKLIRIQAEETSDWKQRLRSTDELSKEILCAFASLRETFLSFCFSQFAGMKRNRRSAVQHKGVPN
jgi:hypothetical protein